MEKSHPSQTSKELWLAVVISVAKQVWQGAGPVVREGILQGSVEPWQEPTL